MNRTRRMASAAALPTTARVATLEVATTALKYITSSWSTPVRPASEKGRQARLLPSFFLSPPSALAINLRAARSACSSAAVLSGRHPRSRNQSNNELHADLRVPAQICGMIWCNGMYGKRYAEVASTPLPKRAREAHTGYPTHQTGAARSIVQGGVPAFATRLKALRHAHAARMRLYA